MPENFTILFDKSKNLASSSQGLRPDLLGNTTQSETQDSSMLLPHFQSGDGLLNHAGRTCSHGGMIDYKSFPISELHLGTFLDSKEFQSWKAIFKTEVCSKSADHHLAMHWIKEVEVAKSIDELMTSRSIVGRTDFPDYDMIDAMIPSASKRLLEAHSLPKKSKCRRAARSKHDRFLRGVQSAYMIYESFRATEAYEAVQELSDLFNVRLQNGVVQDFDVRRDQALLSAKDVLRCIPGRIVEVKIAGLCSASDCLGFALPRNCSKQWTDKSFEIENVCKTH